MPKCYVIVVAFAALAGSCSHSDPPVSVALTGSPTRSERRAFDGAPPVIPHQPLGGSCTTCHAASAREVPGVGLAPPNPHLKTLGLSEASRCRQCHVFKTSAEVFSGNDFEGLAQNLRHGDRLYPHAPPVIPHQVFMREDCAACHAGEAARPEVKCSHAERTNCLQCHARPSP